MERFFWFLLLGSFFESRSFSPESQFYNFSSLWHILAALRDDALHVASLCSNDSFCNLKFFLIRYLYVISACVFGRAIGAAIISVHVTTVATLCLIAIVALTERLRVLSIRLLLLLLQWVWGWDEIWWACLQRLNKLSVNIILLKFGIEQGLWRCCGIGNKNIIGGAASLSYVLFCFLRLGSHLAACLRFIVALGTRLKLWPIYTHLLQRARSSSLNLINSWVTSLSSIIEIQLALTLLVVRKW